MSAQRQPKPYFSAARPRVIAHRGFAIDYPENTLAAFGAAVDLGCSYIETDVHASSDGVSIVSHDDRLDRVAGRPGRISEFTVAELEAVDLGAGQSFVSLAQALAAFPHAFFNIDIKSMDAAEPTVAAIHAAHAEDRVLLTSFSERRRRRAVDALPGVATSASAPIFVVALILAKMGASRLLARWLSRVDALQIPERAIGLRASDARTIARFTAAGVEVHLWTINDEIDMSRLIAEGAHGLVTDRADIAIAVTASGNRDGSEK